jgi:hypothetical protein
MCVSVVKVLLFWLLTEKHLSLMVEILLLI